MELFLSQTEGIIWSSLEKTRRKSIISENLWELCVTFVTFVTNERRLLWNNAPSIEFSYTILRHLWHLWHNTADIHDKAGPPWEKYQFCFSCPLFTVTISFSFIFETNSMELLCDFFSHPTCSGSGCSVSIAFETTYFLLHSLLNPTIERGPPSSSGDCWAKLSTAVPHPRLHSLCLLGRHSERPKYVRTVVCRFWRNFATY